ncbi:MAG: DeoR/GlpR transcriptional regulator [Phycisphaerae bacterium]|nr:DeoR/GlpR transcriptional regulator [Phycisphaerae bacterium]
MGLSAETRRQYIVDQVRTVGRVEVPHVAERFLVTEVTVRRDLAVLANKGLLQKTYGGAISAAAPEYDAAVRYRQTRNLQAKKIIGRLVAENLVEDGDVIYLEAGSTCYEIIPHLAGQRNLTVIVNSLYLMTRLGQMPQHKIVLIGGQYRPDRMDITGAISELVIGQLGGFKAFTSADDISLTGGISGADVATVTFTRRVLERAAKVFFVGDHTKFDNPALYRIADLDRLDGIVTDRQPSPQWRQTAEQKQIRLIYPMG